MVIPPNDRTTPPFLLGTLAGAAVLAHADIREREDGNGQVVYSQTAPPTANAETIKPPPRPATTRDGAQAALGAQIDRLDRARDARQADRATEAAAGKQRAEDDAACAEARGDRARLDSRTRPLLDEAGGSTRRLSQELPERMREEAHNRVTELCGGN